MQAVFWQSRWQEGRIGFHQSDVNPLLLKHFDTLNLPKGSRILVPLSGKSVDMAWLAHQGYDVVGIELVESAVQAFFVEQDITLTMSQPTANIAIKRYQGQLSGQTIELWVADIFALTAADIGQIDAIYDRAALIALPLDTRPQYSEHIRQMSVSVENKNAPQLLITLNYDQSKKEGPPFSISEEQLQQYYGAHYQITPLASQSSTFNGISELPLTENVWLLND